MKIIYQIIQLKLEQRLLFEKKEGFLIAFLTISDIWNPDKKVEAEAVFKSTNDPSSWSE